ncbi:plastid division protein CDP1, chloroplastic [Quillaja saponaria]|uniref:Plastid division protein CDP1, chloroplastic n=1 Tax=Quillaja saponaria TaxID=32244 RepID=A0AAD7M5K4_QUISA|nr:plastid division protein CDP1, chloroplastic [Quillaja saponaria]
MAFAVVPSFASLCCICRINYNSSVQNEDHKFSVLGVGETSCGIGIPRFYVGSHSKRTDILTGKLRFNAVDTGIVENVQAKSTIEIPVTCYQLIGVPARAEKDEIVKSVMCLKSAEIEEGYTMDAVVSRQDLLMDVRDKLLFEPEYAGNVKEKIPPKASLRIHWSWLPGALCLLQEAALKQSEVKPYLHDLLLSMALAECATAKVGFEKNKVSQGFEALARAQCLLRSQISLGKMTLLSQIEESLEELAPSCTLEILAMSHSPENADRRRGAIAALCELLRQGLDVESSCQVQDWPWFMSQALNRLSTTEIVDLLPWENLAITRKNKKSIESQNQRVVIDSICFYKAFLAHVALGFSSKQKDLINKGKTICECLIASEGIDLKFEEAFCLFLLGEGTEVEAVEKLKEIECNSNPTQSSILGKAIVNDSRMNPSLEMWLKDAVLTIFPDTRDCPPSLVNYFGGEKKISVSKKGKGTPQNLPTICHRPLSSTLSLERRNFEESRSYMNSSHHLGFAVKQLTPTESSLLSGKIDNGSTITEASVQLKRDLGIHHNRIWDWWSAHGQLVGRLTFVMVFGCIVFATFKLSVMNLGKLKTGSQWASSKPKPYTSSTAWTSDSSVDYNVGPAYIKGRGIAERLNKLLAMIKIHFMNRLDARNPSNLCSAASLTSSMTKMYRRLMPMEEAETLVKQWQTIKAEALGPSHQVLSLSDVLDESMLVQWQALADAAKDRSCHWRFVLLKLSVLRADILSDGIGEEMAEIEALLEEAAELIDDSQLPNPNYYSTYKVRYVLKRQDDGSWRFCEADIQTP